MPRRILTLASLLACLFAGSGPVFAQAPSAVVARTDGSGQITVDWSAVAAATGYNLYYEPAGGSYTIVNTTPITGTSYTVTGLNDTLTYYFTVHSIVNGTESAASSTPSARSGSTQSAAPTGLTATATSGQVALSWNSVPSAHYVLYRQPLSPSNDTYLYIGPTLSATTYTDTSVTNGTAYTYAVASSTGNGEGNTSGWVAATPLAAPALTAEATANASGTEIDLGWTVSSGATSYTLLRGTTSGGETSYQTGLTTTKFSDTGLATHTTYYYKIMAVASGGSATSGEVSATTGSALLAAPTLSGTATDGQVSLSWTSVTGASVYDLYRLPNPGNDTTGFYTRVSGTSYTDVNVTDGTTYSYQVAADPSAGQGTLSTPALSLTPLASPTVTATPTSASTVSLSWTTITGASGYAVERAPSTAGPWTQIASLIGTSQTDTGLTPATNYDYRVHATNAGGDSGPGNVALAETFPSAPTSLTAIGNNGSVALSWTAPSGDVGSYTLYRGLSAGNEQPTPYAHGVTGTTYTDTNVTNGTAYFYKVTAVNLGGASAVSNEASATPTATAPGPPALTTATAGSGKVTLSWTAGTGSVTSYNLYRSTSSGGEGSTPVETGITGTGWTDTALSNGTTYYYEVTAVNGIGESTKSNEKSAAPASVNNAPGGITNVFIVEGDGHITLLWTAVSGATSYNLYRSTGGGGFGAAQSITTPGMLFNSSAIQAYDTSLSDGTLYTYYITAVSSSGEGPASSLFPAIPVSAATPPAPQYPSAVVTSNNVTVGCNSPAGGSGYYDLYRATTSGTELSLAPVASLSSGSGPYRVGISDGSLTSGTTYYYQIKAAGTPASLPPNTQGIPASYYAEGPASTEVSAKPGGSPPSSAPTTLTATSENFSSFLTWSLVSTASSYNVYYYMNNPPFSPSLSVAVNTTSLTATVLNIPYGGTTGSIQVSVAGVNGDGEGPKSPVNATLGGYGLQPVSTSVAVARGQHGSITITNPTANNFTGHVSLSVSGVPTGATAWFDPTISTAVLSDVLGNGTGGGAYPANDSEGSTLFFSIGSNATPGAYTLTITGTTAAVTNYPSGFTQTVTVTLNIT